MRHARAQALSQLAPVLEAARSQAILVERTPGAFYLRSSGFLHFHEDPAGLFADLKEDFVSFTRYRVSTRAEQRRIIARIRRCLARR